MNLAFFRIFWPFLIFRHLKSLFMMRFGAVVHCKWQHKKTNSIEKPEECFFEITFLFHNGITQNWFQMKEETKRIQFLDCFEVRNMTKTG